MHNAQHSMSYHRLGVGSMGTVSMLGSDVRRGFHVEGNALETSAKRAGIEAETVRERVVIGMAGGWTMQGIVQSVGQDLFEIGYGNWRVCELRARQLVKLAYLGT